MNTRNSRNFGKIGRRRLQVEPLEERLLLSVSPSMVADVNDADAHPSLNAQRLTPVGDLLYFSGSISSPASVTGGLWRTDGTPGGTLLVKETASLDLGTGAPGNLANVSGTLFFWTTASGGQLLWKSDGTEAGTTPIKQFSSEPPSPFGTFIKWHELNGEYYFAANDGMSGHELWKSDGTTAGTLQVADIRLGASGSSPRPLANLNGVLYFNADSGGASGELWRTDGTTAGTVQVTELPGTSNYFGRVTSTGDRFFFTFNDGAHGYELWSSDGTAAGTTMVKDIRAGWDNGQIEQMVNLNGVLYFAANQGSRMEMWRSDGTEAGTQRVDTSLAPAPTRMTNVDGTLFFVRNGIEVWKSDGSAAGTTFVAKPIGTSIGYLANADGLLYFGVTESPLPTYGRTRQFLWKTDGTALGTRRMKETSFGFNSTIFGTIAAIGESVYFAAEDPANGGQQLWKTEGGAGTGVELLNASSIGTLSGNPTEFTVVGDWMYFISASSTHWTGLWKTDGTNAILVKNLRPTPTEFYARQPSEIMNVDGTLYFVASDGVHGYELWKSDGTTEGTLMVKDVNATYQRDSGDPPIRLTNVNGELYFFANDGRYGYYEPWKSDGTAGGTQKLFLPTTNGMKDLVGFGNALFYTHPDFFSSTASLWKTDGTFEGTIRISPPNLAIGSTYLADLEVAGNLIYFVANDGVAGTELWKSDGTEAGAAMVKDISPGSASSSISGLTNINGHLYFTASGSTSDGLWRTNGDEAGTTLIATGFAHSGLGIDVTNIVEMEGSVYFLAVSSGSLDARVELWRCNEGSETPTLIAGFTSLYSYQRRLIAVDDQLYLLVRSSLGQLTYWEVDESDPSPALQSVEDLVVYFDSGFEVFDSNVYMSAYDGVHGNELWRLLASNSLAGDYTSDGVVDGADFLAWQRSFGAAATPAGSSADGDSDGTVGDGDLDVWKANFGTPEPLASAGAVTAAVAALVAEEEAGDGELDTAARIAPKIPPLAPPFEGGGVELRRDAARDALFAAGDFSRLFTMSGDGDDRGLRRRGRASLARRS